MDSDTAILEQLGQGLRNIRSSYDLARDTGVQQRQVGFAVNRLRREGHLIGSKASHGYYLIETQEEVASTCAHIESRKAGIDKTLDSLWSAWQARTMAATTS